MSLMPPPHSSLGAREHGGDGEDTEHSGLDSVEVRWRDEPLEKRRIGG